MKMQNSKFKIQKKYTREEVLEMKKILKSYIIPRVAELWE
jgi:hypothetical protein